MDLKRLLRYLHFESEEKKRGEVLGCGKLPNTLIVSEGEEKETIAVDLSPTSDWKPTTEFATTRTENIIWTPRYPKKEWPNTVEMYLNSIREQSHILSHEYTDQIWCVMHPLFVDKPFTVVIDNLPSGKVIHVYFEDIELFTLIFKPEWKMNDAVTEKIFRWHILRIHDDKDYVELFFQHVNKQLASIEKAKAKQEEESAQRKQEQREYLINHFPNLD